MSRSISVAAKLASQASQIVTASAVRLDFLSGFVRCNSTPYTLTLFGEQYLGVGQLGSISSVAETTDLQAKSITLTLSGVDPALLSLALGDTYQGRDARVYLVLLDQHHAVINDPVLLFRGRMDNMTIELGETALITLTVESRLADWKRPRVSRYTNEEQQRLYPGDRGLEYVAQMVEKELPWGVTDPTRNRR